MPELDFPNDQYPSIGQTYTGANGVIYTYDGVKWVGQGPTSNKGPTGPQGPIGNVGPQGPVGLLTNSVTYQFEGYSLTTATVDSSIIFDSYDNTSTTLIKLTEQDVLGNSTYDWLGFLGATPGTPKGNLHIVDESDKSNFVIFQVTDIAYNSPYFEATVNYAVGSAIPITTSTNVFVGYVKNGTSVSGFVEEGEERSLAFYSAPGVGSTISPISPVTFNTFSSTLQLGSSVSTGSNFALVRNFLSPSVLAGMSFSQYHDSSNANNLTFLRGRNRSDAPAPIEAGDEIASIAFVGYAGTTTDLVGFAGIQAGTIGSPSTKYPQGRLAFFVGAGATQTSSIQAILSATGTWKTSRLDAFSGSNLYVDSNLVPGEQNNNSLGGSSFKWKDLYLGDGPIYLGDHQINVNETGELEINGTPISFSTSVLSSGTYTAVLSTDGILTVGGLTVNGEIIAQKLTIEYTTVTTTNITTDDIFSVGNTTNSVSTDTGALVVAGGVGIGGDVYVGGELNLNGILVNSTTVTNWNTAYTWGDHSIVGYLTTETDPVFSSSAASGITSTNITNWDTAYTWGDHGTVGYLTTVTETDPVFSSSAASGITSTNITNWDTAYTWGDHSIVGYLTATDVTETLEIANLTVGSVVKLTQTEEKFLNTATSIAIVEHDCSSGHIFNHTSIANSFTVNLTNLILEEGYATNITMILNQGATAYSSTGLQINGVTQTVSWQASSTPPDGNANKKDIVNFSILSTGTSSAYLVFGQLVSFG